MLNIGYSINNEESITENSTTSGNWTGYATTEVVEVTSVELYGVATPTDGGDGSNNDGFINKLKSWWTNGIVGKLIIIFSVMYKLLGDDMHKEFINMLNNARKKANYYISRDTEKMHK